MNFLIIRGGRKALGPLGSGGVRPGPARRARPVNLSQASSGQRQEGAGPGQRPSSCLCIPLSVRLSKTLAQVKARVRGRRAPSGWEPARLRPLGTRLPWLPAAPPAPLSWGARGPGFLEVRSEGEEAGASPCKARRGREKEREAGGAGPRAPAGQVNGLRARWFSLPAPCAVWPGLAVSVRPPLSPAFSLLFVNA